MGISPDIIVTRSDQALPPAIKEKIALFCDVKSDCVIENTTLPSLYAAPLMLHRNGLDEVVCRELGIDVPEPELTQWELMVRKIDSPKTGATIALVGKYVQLPDAYLSIVESLHHAGFEAGAQITIRWVDSEHVTEQTVDRLLGQVDAVLIPGGFGERGIEGKIQACRYARERNLPYLGICLGMQVAVIEFARHVCALEGAHSTEFDQDSPYPVIDLLPGQAGKVGSGGTMRLGAYPCKVAEGSRLYSLYKTELISERHRHRFEFNNTFRKELVQQGLGICGTSPDDRLVEAIELSNKEFFIGVQFHPEFKSRPNRPHPLFLGFVQAAMGSKKPPNQLDGRG